MNHWESLVSKNNHTYKEVILLLQGIADFFLEKEKFSDQNTGIFAGKSGVALFLIYYYEFTNSEVYIRKAIDIIKEIFNDFKGNVYEPDFSFEDGIAGIGWLINHIDQLGAVDIKVESVFENFYDIIYQHTLDNLSSGNHNLYNGSIGLINTQASYPNNRHQLIDIVNKIEQVFHLKQGGLIQTDVDLNTTEKEIGLTLYTGLSGFLVILSRCISQNINVDKSKTLCKKISRHILDSHTCNGDEFFFVGANNIGQTKYSAPSWLTGDLGVIYSLIFYANVIGDDDLMEKSISILDKYSRNNNVSLRYRNSLAVGNASQFLVYMLIHQITRKNNHREVADYWLAETLKTINADGFLEYDLSGVNWIKSYRSGLLYGLDGVGLALISSISSISPSWCQSIILQ